MGQIKRLTVLLALSVAIIAVNGQIYFNEGPIETITSPIQTAQTDPKRAPAPEVAPDPPVLIEEAEEKPTEQNGPVSTQPTWEQGPQIEQPPVEESPGYNSVFAEEPVPAPAPSLIEEQTVNIPAEPAAVVTIDPIEPLIPEPIVDTNSPVELPAEEAPVSPPIADVAALPADPQQQPAGVTNTTSEEFIVAPGLDFVLRNGNGDDSWAIPDWSWAGYAGGNYKPVEPGKQFNVMDFGAKRDGKTDDAPSIQGAIDVAGSEGGGTVYLPAGRYLIGNQITISKSNVVLKGAGKSLTVLYSPKPLSKVIKDGRKYINSIGQSRFSWADGFVRITGQPLYSSDSTLLGKVINKKSRGWTSLIVDTPEKFNPGMWVRLYMSDPSNVPTSESLASALYANKVEDSVCGKKCLKGLRGKKDLIRWVARVKSVQGNKVILERPLPMDVNPLWKAELHDVPEWKMPQNCGIEGIRIEFALERMQPHLKEAGFNGIAVEHALNAWVKDVAIVNSDNAIVVRFSSHVTVDGVEIYANGDRTLDRKYKTQGHIGIGLYESSDVEVTDFNLKSKMLHDTTVRGTILCVFHNGRGIDLNLDSHRGAPFGTLYSSIDLGKGTRVFSSGGSGGNGFPAAAYTTYWNLKAGSEQGKVIEIPSKTSLGECTYGTKLAFQGKFIGKGCKTYYVSKDKRPNPSDLFASQVYKRLSGIQS